MKKIKNCDVGVKLPHLTKLLRVMKATCFLIMIALVQVSASTYSQSAKLTFDLKNVTLDEVFKKIEESSEFRFFYDAARVDFSKKITLNADNFEIKQILNDVLNGLSISYEIYDRYIILKNKGDGRSSEIVFTLQQGTISGTVTDQSGSPLPGVTVIIKGTSQGTVTNNDGEYTLANIPEDATLAFSFVGMRTQEIVIGSQTTINVEMAIDAIGIEEIVTVGYGIQKKTSVTSAVSKMDGEELSSIPLTNLSSGISGRVSGVITKQTSGQPGQDATQIYIRGVSSTGSTAALVIVDGIPRDFNQLDPNTIESITILKDASAVAPYGVAGANGVVLVTTKKGKAGVASFKYNGYVGFQNPTILPDILDGYQYALMRNIGAENVGLPAKYTEEELQLFKNQSEPDLYPSINAYDEFVKKNTLTTNHNIEVSGGTDKIDYYASIGYLRQNGYWTTNYKDRFNFTVDLGIKATKITKLSINVKGREQQNMYPGLEGTNGTAYTWEVMRAALPIQPVVYSNGLYGRTIGPSIHGSGYWKERIHQVFTQISVDQKLPFIQGLSFKATVAYDTYNNLSTVWYEPRVIWSIVDRTVKPLEFRSSTAGVSKPRLFKTLNATKQPVTQSSLNYSRTFLDKHNISALLLYETKESNFERLDARRINYDLFIDELNMGSSNQADISNSGYSTKARQTGLVFRLNYDYSSKYLVELSGRYDGHYYFAPGKRFGFFPAVSLGYRLSEENFMKEMSWIDNLKIRGSYGEVGALAGAPYQYLSAYQVNSNSSVIGGAVQSSISETSEANKNITWERAKMKNVGLEGIFWKGLLSFEVDYFYELRSNMLVTPNVIVPAEYGIGISQVNSGEMENRGIDFSVGSSYKVSKDLQVSLNGTFTYAKNKLLQVFEVPATYDNPFRRKTGRPLGTHFGYVSLGYFQVEDFDNEGNLLPGIATQPWGTVHPGDIRYKDLNDDGEITDYDQTEIGAPLVPEIIYGMGGNVLYKRFDLSFLFQGAGRVSIFKTAGAWLFNNNYSGYTENLDYWTPENRNALNPKPKPNPTTNDSRLSSHWLFDASYLRLKNITLAYSIPSFIVEKIRLQNTRIFISGQNLLTFTKFTNYDPEMNTNSGNNYPLMKVVTFGINVEF